MRGKELRKTQGITLIALVITIIVLLILAGVSVSMLSGNNGVLQKATESKQANQNAEDLEKVQLAAQAAVADGLGTINLIDTTGADTVKGSLKRELINEGISTSYNGDGVVTIDGKTYTVSSNGKVETIKALQESEITNTNLKNNNGISEVITGEVPIPTGYTYKEGTKDIGVVIEDSSENEYVWVPVENATDMTENVGLCTDYDNDNNATTAGFSSATDMETKLSSDFNEMKASVSKYKGFYIGRYELTAEGERSGAPLLMINWYGLYAKCKELTQANTNTEVRMVWNSQWNKIMTWMKNIQNPNVPGEFYTEDSTGMGYYCYDNDGNPITEIIGTINTGSNEAYKVKNIYDLAGNCLEWTQEVDITDGRANRGGGYFNAGSDWQVSSRSNLNPDFLDNDFISSRATLYIK